MYLRRTLTFLLIIMGVLIGSIAAIADDVINSSDVIMIFGELKEEGREEDIIKEDEMRLEHHLPDIKIPQVLKLSAADAEPQDELDENSEAEDANVVIEETVPATEEVVEEVTEAPTEETQGEEVIEEPEYVWDGPVLNSYIGTVEGPSGKETYYNLPMSRVVEIMHELGFEGEYWVRDDGVKMFGDYIMVAADLSHRPKGTILPTSLGMAMVCDTGGFVKWNSYQIDIAVAW